MFNPKDEALMAKLRLKLAEEAAETVEDVGFEASVLQPGEDLELKVTSENEIMKKQESNYSSLEIETAEDYANSCELDNVEAVVSLQVKGMSCAVCTGRVERTIKDIDGIGTATVSLATCRANVQIPKIGKEPDPMRIEGLAETCANAVTKAGYECEVLEVYKPSDGAGSGMLLSESAAKLQEARQEELNSWANLLVISVIFTAPLVILHYTSMMGTISDSMDNQNWKQWMSFLLATPVQFGVGKRFYISAYHSFSNGRVMGMDFLVCLGTTAAYTYSIIVLGISTFGSDSIVEADAIHLKATFETSAMLITFVSLGKYLEAYARGKTAVALQRLMELQPAIATSCVIPDSHKEVDEDTGIEEISDSLNINGMEKTEVEIKEVQVGEYLLVIPGQRIPTDGKVVYRDGAGDKSYVDESALSGEPFPVAKAIGDDVYGSTVNQFSTLIIKVTATGGSTVIARIVRLIEEAQVNRAPIQAMADSIAAVFAPTVLCLSALTYVCWLVFNSSVDAQERFFVALMSAISVIVVACPCALGKYTCRSIPKMLYNNIMSQQSYNKYAKYFPPIGLATPTAVMVGTGVGASNGLLIKGGAVLENAHQVDTVVFDKTGTITTGKAVLGERMEFMDNARDDEPLLQNLPPQVNKHNLCLWLASCAEMTSEHPLAKAIVNGGRNNIGADFTCSREGVVVNQCSVVPGRGVEALVSREGWGSWWVRVGKRSFVKAPPGTSLNEEPESVEVNT